MSKIRIICPECGHKHTYSAPDKIVSLGVRAKRVTANQFEYSLTAPAEITQDDTRLSTVMDDLILTGALGCAAGAVGGFLAALAAPDYAIEISGLSSSIGLSVAWGWLCAEHNQRLKRVLPWFLENRDKWRHPEPGNNGEIQLTVDHRYRDSYSEAGRSIAILGVLPVDVARFREWAQAAIRGDSLAIKQWTGAQRLFSRDEYDKLLAKLREANIVANLPGRGNLLTVPGKHALRRIVTATPSPTPPQERA